MVLDILLVCYVMNGIHRKQEMGDSNDLAMELSLIHLNRIYDYFQGIIIYVIKKLNLKDIIITNQTTVFNIF